ncbi:hypothetical protein EDB87DRAFT_1819224 [Lactarius vividus]|nr:hypothetical protein EDB87DRAFT_1819224 [Lactarius vividus]
MATSESQHPTREQITSPVPFSPPFDRADADADVVLIIAMSMASLVFETMFSLPQPQIGTDAVSQGSPPAINLAENGAVLANLLTAVYPVIPGEPCSPSDFAVAAKKGLAGVARAATKASLQHPLTLGDILEDNPKLDPADIPAPVSAAIPSSLFGRDRFRTWISFGMSRNRAGVDECNLVAAIALAHKGCSQSSAKRQKFNPAYFVT